MNVKYRIVLATENVLVVNACADAASRGNSAISVIIFDLISFNFLSLSFKKKCAKLMFFLAEKCY